MTEIPTKIATLDDALRQGLSREEFDRIIEILARPPNITELAIFAVMWSEHCSYKNSILELKTLPRSGGRLLAAAGEENAGVVDIGDGWAVAFKIESHNHPSAVEPFQGAATGVGGILRDIFTMGSRPLAVLNSLRFGAIDDPRSRYLFDGVVRGIGYYGNCFGVPTVAGDAAFDPAYRDNPLVNVMAVGIVRHDGILRARAAGVGNPVYYVGSRTGRDGIHGATFASEELDHENESKRPNVQVGDPFAEKLLLEATLELAATGAVVSIQDLGAAGLTCSSSEMAAAGGVGMELNLDLVPLRDESMEPWEIMLSESQERMLMVVRAGREHEVERIFHRWDLAAVNIGSVTADGNLRLTRRGEVAAEVPAWHLVLGGGAPQYRRESRPPVRDAVSDSPLTALPPPDPAAILLKLLADPNIASKEWVYCQYDQSVRANTALEPGRGDAAVVRVEGSSKGFAVKTDSNGRWVKIDPRNGTAHTVCEAARNVACVGARPIAVTNCLNFGNPYKPEVYHDFREAVAGLGEACRALGTPVTGGNVSFYNETGGKPVLPTPVVGMLGLFEDVSKFVGAAFRSDGDTVCLLGSDRLISTPSEDRRHRWAGSIYHRYAGIHEESGTIQPPDYDGDNRLIDLLLELCERRITIAAHDVSDGGLAVCIAECCIMDRDEYVGADIDYPTVGDDYEFLFDEAPGRVVVSVGSVEWQCVQGIAEKFGVACRKIGVTGGARFTWRGHFDLPLGELAAAYYNAIPDFMDRLI